MTRPAKLEICVQNINETEHKERGKLFENLQTVTSMNTRTVQCDNEHVHVIRTLP
jgi:hypothetical protein